MSRTGEVVLSIIGALVFSGTIVLGILAMVFGGSEAVHDQFISDMKAEDPTLTATDIDEYHTLFDIASGAGIYLIIIALIIIILGIVAMFLLKDDKNPKAAGILLIITGAVGTILTLFAGFLGGLLYVIAGIMALVRKPPETEELSDTY